jgi:hypothetical protein
MLGASRTSKGYAGVLAIAFIISLFVAPTSHAAPKTGVLSILHVVSGDERATVVDIFDGKRRIFNNVKVGQLRSVRLAQGRYDLAIYQDGSSPGNGVPLLRRNGVDLVRNSNITVAIHPDTDGAVTSSSFTNAGMKNPAGLGRLTVRHIAQAPQVDVRISEATAFAALTNQGEASNQLPVGTQLLDVTQAGTPDVLITPRMIPVNRPLNTIIYIWGSQDDGLRLALQRIPLRS